MKKYLCMAMLLAALSLTSCFSTKMVCLEDMKQDKTYPITGQQEMKIQRDDRLGILVNSRNPELTVPFNVFGEAFQVDEAGKVSAASSGRIKTEKGYEVDLNGYIDFPLLGKISVLGLSRKEAAAEIRKLLISEGLISEPLVYVDILNIRVSAMGEVNRPGVLEIEDNRVTLLEAIAKAGGLTSNAAMDKVAVIREEGDVRRLYMHDVRSPEVFSSPCYYLQQNDVIYVHPRYVNSTVREDRTLKFLSFGTGLISLILSLAILYK